MKNYLREKLTLLFLLFVSISVHLKAQLPCNVLVGYYQTSWGSYIPLANVNPAYNVFCLSFLEAGGGDGVADNNNVNALSFYAINDNKLRQDIPFVQAQGKKVLISIGGGMGSFKLNSTNEKNIFVAKVMDVISSYGLDGIDIDLERPVYLRQVNGGTITNPEPHIRLMIEAIEELLVWYQITYNKKMILTMVPEVAYSSGGLSPYLASTYGVAYLPMIEALRDEIDLLMVQLYNTGGPMYGLDGVLYPPSSPDFIVSQIDALIKGFTCANGKGVYNGMSPSQIAVCLPASGAAASGYFSPAAVSAALAYLRGEGPQPGAYTLSKAGGYPDLHGLATWSINMDLINGYSFANNYSTIFNSCLTTGEEELLSTNANLIYPNPASNVLHFNGTQTQTVKIFDDLGKLVLEQNVEANGIIDVSQLSGGLYIIKVEGSTQKVLIQN